MEKPLHPDYVYIDSAILKQRVALHKKSGWLFCQDKYPNGKFVSYSPQELEILGKSGEPISIEVHRIKKVFTGEVVAYERIGTGNNDPGKSNEGESPDSSNNTSNPGGQVQSPSGNGAGNESGELDIF